MQHALENAKNTVKPQAVQPPAPVATSCSFSPLRGPCITSFQPVSTNKVLQTESSAFPYEISKVFKGGESYKGSLAAHLGEWAHKVEITVKDASQRKVKEFVINSEEDIAALEKYITSNVPKEKPPPPKAMKGAWAMLDSGSAPNVADVPKHFPGHPVRESKAQRKGVKYVDASGGQIPNEGETCLVHRDEKQGDFGFVFQNGKVHCPILSVRKMVRRGCRVTFKRGGGIIRYADGRKLRFVERLGVFFVNLNVLDPDVAKNSLAFIKGPDEQDEPEPVFSRPERSA